MARPKTRKIDGVRYKTINACLSEFFRCDVSGIDSIKGKWLWMDADGKRHSQSAQAGIRDIRKRDVWGFVNDKTTIHYFIRKRTKIDEAVRFFAHELGHMRKPFHRHDREEEKACKYAEVAQAALNISAQLIDEGIIRG